MRKLLASFLLKALPVLLLGILAAPIAQATGVSIHDIQGTKSTTAEVISPLVGQTVNTSGVVTAITSTGFFIQTPDASADSNPLTPEGIYVNTGSAPPASVVIGNNLQVSGTVTTVPATTQSHTPGTEITVNPATGITVVSTNQPLPAPIVIDASKLSATGSIYQLTPYEGMRVTFASLTSVSGTGGTLDEVNETYTSNGQFYAVLTSTSGTTPRPFREPGIDLRDAAVPNTPANVAQFDDNPERILVDSGTLVGSTPIDVSSGAALPNVTGVLDFTASLDSTYTPARLLIDPSYSQSNITPGITPQTTAAAGSNIFTVAAFNVQRLFNTSSADNLYYVPAGVAPNTGANGTTFPSTAVNVTSAAYQRRIAKIALAICNNLRSPDIVALEEVENLSVVTDIATQIKNTAGCGTVYAAYGTNNTSDSTVFYTQDSTGISVGFLVKTTTVDFGGIGQTGQDTTFTLTGTTTPLLVLNDRPWLAIQAGIKRAGALDYTVAVIVNDMQSMAGENSPTSSVIRQKRELQAENIAQAIQNLQAQHFHIISVGDFNAFEFSDGYTDSLATYTNTNVLPATQVVQPGKAGLVTPALTDLTLQIADKTQRWSYVENGNAEVLDHIAVSSELAASTTLNYIHFNADFPVIDYNDDTTATRVSDHDVALGYFTIPPPVLLASVVPTNATFASTIVGSSSAPQVFTISNSGDASFTVNSITTSGDFAQTNTCGTLPTTLAPGASCTASVVFTPTAAGTRTGSFSVVTSVNANALTAPLTGTGTTPTTPDFTLTDSAGHATTTITVAAGSTGSATLVFTPVNGFNAAIISTCAAQGTAPAGVTCTAPASFTLSGTAAVNKTVSFTTTARTSSGGIALDSIPRSPWTATALLSLIGLVMFLAGRTRRLARLAGLLTLLLALFLPALGCGGSGSGGGGGGGGNTGTPAGTYTYTVTATSGTLSHTETVTLIVQ
ncbi:choice-of-anchor D domain-containing protein [Edaphobacter sp.]|uniref:choice-of-anchor D domain-containing protein n=1 Tax=Edaphobacter sp. TaxID=1934404 RepID=UPI002DBF938A|nr:choice-of-anchor D domain-containing protein [Edaphobacter sp.]HEU5342199.1 choice-of-anchor D domain-containing protein [Edaphobacter sp.]